MTLYDQLGGAPAVSTALDRFYAKVKVDPLLSPFFAKTDFADLKKRAEGFFAFAAGGASDYRGPTLRQFGAMGRRLVPEQFLGGQPDVEILSGRSAFLQPEKIGAPLDIGLRGLIQMGRGFGGRVHAW